MTNVGVLERPSLPHRSQFLQRTPLDTIFITRVIPVAKSGRQAGGSLRRQIRNPFACRSNAETRHP
jgi:hypothetical protein